MAVTAQINVLTFSILPIYRIKRLRELTVMPVHYAKILLIPVYRLLTVFDHIFGLGFSVFNVRVRITESAPTSTIENTGACMLLASYVVYLNFSHFPQIYEFLTPPQSIYLIKNTEMLTRRQKQLLEAQIYKLIKESIYENGFDENYFFEKGDGESDGGKDSKDETNGKEAIVYKWLDSAQELHSVLAYKLYPDLSEGGARSEFSKKYRGKDDDGKPYRFDELEINKLYNMRSDYIDSASLDKKVR